MSHRYVVQFAERRMGGSRIFSQSVCVCVGGGGGDALSLDQGGSNKVLPFKTYYLGNRGEGPAPLPPSGSAHETENIRKAYI